MFLHGTCFLLDMPFRKAHTTDLRLRFWIPAMMEMEWSNQQQSQRGPTPLKDLQALRTVSALSVIQV
jgi:hypothetical protein